MLNGRAQVICDYIRRVKEGNIFYNCTPREYKVYSVAILLFTLRFHWWGYYISTIYSGKMESNPVVMRAISSLVSSLPLAQEHTESFDAQSSQVLTS